jgi:hypothetical protein
VLGPPADAGPETGALSDRAVGQGPIELIAAHTALLSNETIVVDVPNAVNGNPDHLVPGDLLLLILYVGTGRMADAQLTDEFGWTMSQRLAPVSCGGFFVWYGHRVVQANDPTSYTFQFFSRDAVADTTYALVAYRGVDPAQPFAAQFAGGLRQGNFTLPAMNVGVPDTTLLAMFVDGFNTGGLWQAPGGMMFIIGSGVFGIFEAPRQPAGPSLMESATTIPDGCATLFVAALKPK